MLDLRAAPLEGRSLPDALRAMTEGRPADEAPDVSLSIVDGERPLPARVEAGLYRIAEEAFRNALRHAAASSVRLRLALTPEQAIFHIVDDGHGFDPSRVPSGRFGLAGMRERAKLLGGQLDLASSEDEGTRIEVEVPLV